MKTTIDLSGNWNLGLDEEKQEFPVLLNDTMPLPGTTSYYQKGTKNEQAETGCLTDEYKFEGYAWFSKEIEIAETLADKTIFLYLERTRVTTVWIDDQKIGSQNSLCTPHIYDLTGCLPAGKHTLMIRVDNTDYPTKGGHLTSRDTQTNWNGITGKIELQFFEKSYFSDVQVYPNILDRTVTIKSTIIGGFEGGAISVSAESVNSETEHKVNQQQFPYNANEPESNKAEIVYSLGEHALLWSEHAPNLYRLKLNLSIDGTVVDTHEVMTGLREFRAEGDKFTINGTKTFLRGKHDGLIFPLTGFAPTTLDEWLRVLNIAKSYGINHYRFHTCCPPEAAFSAADRLGIYMEPELPFWGTLTDEQDENHNQAEQDYLVNEGFSILKRFGNHPSFVMMSLGNELWGSQTRMNEILKRYKEYDNRHLYTQGSNNFQFFPTVLEQDDFFCGVRFSKERLIRGSYAMCDAPLGHVQTDRPSTMTDYDQHISPAAFDDSAAPSDSTIEDTIEIQYGTEAKTVKASEAKDELIPDVPVVSHEIGQYETYPDFREIEKYTGSLKAKNFEIFKQRLEEKGLGDLAQLYFECSGKLAVDCYKEELEAAFRSRKLAGFQLLDLQDFSGQGTALVGMLDAFMDSKGLISPEEWRKYCSDAVLLARFPKYNYTAEELFHARIELSYYRNLPLHRFTLTWELRQADTVCRQGEVFAEHDGSNNYIDIGSMDFTMPNVSTMEPFTLTMKINGTDMEKSYELWVYPKAVTFDISAIHRFDELSEEAIALLERGENIVLFPKLHHLNHSIEGLYCADFWCYPMFRSISESMNKPVPVGTMGLLIEHQHPVLKHFPSERYSTWPWWDIVTHSRSVILDETAASFRPIVQTIDNFERNHKLGILFESQVLNGNVLVCAFDYDQIVKTPQGKQLMSSIISYVTSEDFQPSAKLDVSELRKLLS